MAETHFYEGIDTSKPLHGNDRRANIQSAPIEVQQKVLDIIIEEARKENFNNHDLAYYIAIAKHESRFNPDAASETSTASGIAQVIDETGKAHGIDNSNRFDARASIKAGLHYFSKLKSKVKHDYGTLNNETCVVIYYAYHYGESSYWKYSTFEMLKPKKLRARDQLIPLNELISSAKYQASKLVYEHALQIEQILNDTHGITIQLTDVYGNEMKNRQVIAVFKRAIAQQSTNVATQATTKRATENSNDYPAQANSDSSDISPKEIQLSLPDSAANQVKSIDATNDDVSTTDISLERLDVQAAASEADVDPDVNASIENSDALGVTPSSTTEEVVSEGRANDSVEPALTVEYELYAQVFTTDSNGCIPEIETDQASPVLVMVPRMYHQEYTNAVSTGQIPELEKIHTLPLRDEPELHPAIPTQPPKAQTQVSTGRTSKSNQVLQRVSREQVTSTSLKVPHGHQITFDEAVLALKKIGWDHVYASAFSYVKQLYTRPKIKEAPFNPQPITPGKARVEAITSNLKNADIKKTKVNESVTTAKKMNVKEVYVAGATPWMDVAIAEQKKKVYEDPASFRHDAEWKKLDAIYNKADKHLKALDKALKDAKRAKPSAVANSKVEAIQAQIAETKKARAEASAQMQEIQLHFNNPDVMKYYAATTLHQTRTDGSDLSSDETPWCSAFVNWCLLQAGYLGTRDAAAISWDKTQWGEVLDEPRYGAITVVRQGGGHHVGFFVSLQESKSGQRVQMLGGNQGSPKGGVTETSICNANEVVSYHWPTPANKLR